MVDPNTEALLQKWRSYGVGDSITEAEADALIDALAARLQEYEGPSGLREQLEAARKGEQIELRLRQQAEEEAGTYMNLYDTAQEKLQKAEARLREVEEALVEAAIPLEVLHGEIPYFRHGPLRKKLRALSPELQAQIAAAVTKIRAGVKDDG